MQIDGCINELLLLHRTILIGLQQYKITMVKKLVIRKLKLGKLVSFV
jgi:hypothetical protein